MTVEQLFEVLKIDKPSKILKEKEIELFKLIPELEKSKGFKQNNEWHIFDVYEHILHVVDNISDDLILRLSALFHDIGKPYVYTEDENGIGHFYGHFDKSEEIFKDFADRNKLEENIVKVVSKLIKYHDIRVSKLNTEQLLNIRNIFNDEEIERLYELRKAYLLAQNPKFHYILEDYEVEKKKILSIAERRKLR